MRLRLAWGPGMVVRASPQVTGGHWSQPGPLAPRLCPVQAWRPLAWLCVSCLVTSCRGPRAGTLFLLLFSLFQAFSHSACFLSVYYWGAVTLGCLDHKPIGPGSRLLPVRGYTPLSFPQHQGSHSLGRGAAIPPSPSVPGCFQDRSCLGQLCVPDCLLGSPLTKLP